MSTGKLDDSADSPDIGLLIDVCVGRIVSGIEYPEYARATMNAATTLLPPPPTGALREDPDLHRRLVLTIANEIWRWTPHPSQRYAPGTLPRVGRNDPCLCGSGRKYKQCCQSMQGTFPDMRMNLLPVVLARMPRTRWPELVGSRIAVEQVAHCAHEWIAVGDAKLVEALLEPWFADDTRFDAQHEPLLDELLNAYLELQRPIKKKRLLDRAERHGDRTIRASVLQQRVSIAADREDYAKAWRLFGEAQRVAPDSPSLGLLEVTVLSSEGRYEEARQRADFHARRLRALGDPDFVDLVGALERAASSDGDPVRGMLEAGLFDDPDDEEDPEVDELLQAFARAPKPQPLYRLQPHGDQAGPLEPQPKLARALAHWDEVAPAIPHSPLQPDGTDDLLDSCPLWAGVLNRYPVLWQSFEAIEVVVRTCYMLDDPHLDKHVLRPLLERAETLLRAVLRDQDAEGLQLEWGFLENRPALALIGTRISEDMDHPPDDDSIARLEWILQLNPRDNGGFRVALARRYMETGRYDDALALCDRFAEDFAPTRYNRVLALYALGRTDDARDALTEAVDAYPKPLRWLLKKSVRPPTGPMNRITLGGDDEALAYRMEMHDLWKRLGALEWARKASATLRKA